MLAAAAGTGVGGTAPGTRVAFVNGNFEARLTGWIPGGTVAVGTVAHTGRRAARVGGTSGHPGNSAVSKTFVAPQDAGALRIWYRVVCHGSLTHNWATVTLTDLATRETDTLLGKSCRNSGKWQRISTNLSAHAGHRMRLRLGSHDDESDGPPTYVLFDDVAIVHADFSVAAVRSVRVAPGRSVRIRVATIRTVASERAIALSVKHLPSGVTAAWHPAKVVAGASSILTLTATHGALGASAKLSIIGRSSSAVHVAPVSLSVRSTTPTPPPVACAGVPMTAGQRDIDNHPPGTKFCLAGTHNWTLSPKTGDQFFGPAVLDGGHSTRYAITAYSGAMNVVLANVEVRNYRVTNQQGAIQGGGGWLLKNVKSHDNGTPGATGVAGGYGAALGQNERIIGGRYYNNRQGGIAGGGGVNAVIDGAEIDHNNFTDDTYRQQNIDCNYDAGGVKWVAPNVTVQNSQIHDNACRGLWTDGGAHGTVIRNNHIYNNFDEGIFVEISGQTTITGNVVTGNGFRSQVVALNTVPQSHNNGCVGYLGSGIMVATSGQTTLSSGAVLISANDVERNCNGITAFEQVRIGSDYSVCGAVDPKCELRHLHIQYNTIVASKDARALNRVGYFNEDGADLSTHDIVWGAGNGVSGMHNCQFTCNY